MLNSEQEILDCWGLLGLPLYVKIKDEYIELSAVAVGPNVKDIQKKEISFCIDLYIKNITSNKCPKNFKNETTYFQIFLEFCFAQGITCIDEVKTHHIETLESTFLKRMVANSLNRRFSVYRHFFRKCDEWGYIHENPFLKVKQRKIIKVHFTPWTKEQFKAFIKLTSGQYTSIFKFMWLTGCRPMELKNLKWDDINNNDHIITFQCQKNKGGTRKFPITDAVSVLLHSMAIDSMHVFSVNKKQVSNDSLYQYAKHRLDQLGFAKLSPYGLRHAFACGLNNADVNAFTIKELMGHSDIRTTLNYIHPNDENLHNALNKANR